jgi:hypothetical protein
MVLEFQMRRLTVSLTEYVRVTAVMKPPMTLIPLECPGQLGPPALLTELHFQGDWNCD